MVYDFAPISIESIINAALVYNNMYGRIRTPRDWIKTPMAE